MIGHKINNKRALLLQIPLCIPDVKIEKFDVPTKKFCENIFDASILKPGQHRKPKLFGSAQDRLSLFIFG